MKILIINYEYPPLGGGGGIFTRDLVEEFVREGHYVDVVTTHFKGLSLYEKINGVNIYRVKVLCRKSLEIATILSLLTFPILAFLKALILCARNKYDVINTHFAVPSGIVSLILVKILRIPSVLSILGGDIFDPSKKLSPHRHFLFRRAVKMVLNNAEIVIAESTDTAKNARKYYNFNKQINVIPIGIPRKIFFSSSRAELDMDKNNIYLISVGRLVKRKRYDILIKAFNIVLKKINNSQLIILGDGPEKQNLFELAETLGILNKIKFAGRVTDEQKNQYLQNSDLYILSSEHEGFGIVILEAMSHGLPIISTNIGGQTDIITSSKNGILINPNDEEEMARAIISLALDERARKIMAVNNKQYFNNYDIKVTAKKYIDIFEKVISIV
ncbi:group 1 glycosyl transferase [Candidatus Omnitrophus magneticus]|uniref:Group 1 glycosyl transferase n=1 Tax=Candidatus Omnitrophus magneticus TaxID=1609969 RepID=A0A0F0CT84_9BACT|nr:group 1 glycosyl transferase [Candidatus Omnitrophus magneticus]